MSDDEFYRFSCTGCGKHVKKKKHRGRRATRCKECRGVVAAPVAPKAAKPKKPTTTTIICGDCHEPFTIERRRGKPPSTCPSCKTSVRALGKKLEEQRKVVNPDDDTEGVVFDEDGIRIRKVNPKGLRLYAVRLPGEPRPIWKDTLAEARRLVEERV